MNNNFKKIILVLLAIVVVIGAGQYFGFTNQTASNSSSMPTLASSNANTANGTVNNLGSDEQAANAAVTAAAKSLSASTSSTNAASSAAATVSNNIASNGSLKTFNSLIQTAGLGSILSSPSAVTVFAPTDAAFAKLPAATLANWQKPENKTELRRVLSYHIVNGKYSASDLSKATTGPQTLAGLSVNVSNSNGVQINNAKVASADISSSNGIIHTIDTVLMPSAASIPTN